MKESEYITASACINLCNVITPLERVISSGVKEVNHHELSGIINKLQEWRDVLFAAIKIDFDPLSTEHKERATNKSTANPPYTKCKKCGQSAVHLAMANSITFAGDDDDDNGNGSEYSGEDRETDVCIGAHICFECGKVEDVFVEYPEQSD